MTAIRFSAIVVLQVLLLGACSSSDPVAPDDWTLKKPGRGSVFVFDRYAIDELGNEGPKGIRTYDTIEIVDAEVSAYDRAGLVLAKVHYPLGNTALMHYGYDSNQNIISNSLFFHEEGYSLWFRPANFFFRLPMSTGVTVRDSLIKDTTDFFGPVTYSVSYASRSLGRESLSIAGTLIPTYKFEMLRNVNTQSTQYTDNLQRMAILWYAPSLGAFVRITESFKRDSKATGYRLELTSFSLK